MDQYNKALEEALARNSDDTKRWEKYQEDLKQTAISLKEFIKSVNVSIMVPLGKKALLQGKLIHTNEVTVSHGSSIFTDCSQADALKIIQHRLKLSSEKLKALNTERDLFRGKLELPITENLFAANDPNCKEIIEDYVEETEQEWRMKHRESVKKQKLEESEKWKEVTCSKDKSHEDVLKLLEDLELMEELDDELDKLEVHDDESLKKLMSGESVPDSKKRISFSEAPSSKKDSKEIAVVAPKLTTEGNLESPGVVSLLKGYRGRIEEILKNVEKNDELLDFFLDLSNLKEEMDDDIDQLNSEEDEESESEDSEDYSEQISDKTAQPLKSLAPISGPATKNVKFSESFDVKMIESQNIVQDSGEDETTLHINVKHSKNVFKPNVNSADVVAHPADIYKKFQHCFNSTTTRKSILKRSISTEKDNVEKIESVDKQQVEKPVVKIFHGEILGEIVERNDRQLEDNVVHIEPKAEVKRVSKFKQMRQKS